MVPLRSPANARGTDQTITFNQTLDTDVQVLAVRPERLPPNITVQVLAVRPDGSRVPMIRLNTRPDWSRRYWLDNPIALPRGSRIEVVANLANPDILSEAIGAISASRNPPAAGPIELAMNVVPMHAKPAAP